MAKFRVVGVYPSGKELDQVVDAVSAANAGTMAQVAGVHVTGIVDEFGQSHPVPMPPPTASSVVIAPAPAWSAGVAAVLSFFIPGLGQMYKGQIINGLAWLVCVVIGYACFVVPGLVLHLFCVVGAASGDPTKR